MSLDSDTLVYATDADTGEELSDKPVVCMWFALCKNPANGLREGPIGNGAFGPIPICRRCDDKVERLSA